MKISIIMCVLNSMPYIMSSIESFRKQKYKNKELIIINSKSNDNTDDYLKNVNDKNIKKFNLNGSIYKSLNFGISKSKGDIIGILHSDDIFFSKLTLADIAKEYKKNKADIIFGNILYSKKNDLTKIKRNWSKINIREKYDIPPHTGTFITKKIYNNFKYNEKYLISSDTDFLIRIFKDQAKYKYLNKNITIMRTGGLSTNLSFLIKKTKEDLIIFKKHKLSTYDYFKKILSKTNQFLFKENIRVTQFHKIMNNCSRIKFLEIKKISKIYGKVISALNLAFISYNYKYNLRTHNYLFWSDGVFSTFFTKVKKIPGREYFLKIINIINKKKNNYKFKRIYVLGNLPPISKKWLSKNLNFTYSHINLPFGNIEKIKKFIKRLKLQNNSLVILTLPTPKQELLGNFILKKFNKNIILCIGGSINILSGQERASPDILNLFNLEWLWRLRFDTKRRFNRLIESIFIFFKIIFFNKNSIF